MVLVVLGTGHLSVLLDHLVTHLRADVGRYRANVTGTLWLRVLLDSAAQPQAHVVLLENSSTATSARESKGT